MATLFWAAETRELEALEGTAEVPARFGDPPAGRGATAGALYGLR